MSVAMRQAAGLLASAVIVSAVIVACRPSGGVGYVQIKTVPAAPVTQAALYLGSTKLAPIRQGTALLRQHVGTLKLQAEAFGGAPPLLESTFPWLAFGFSCGCSLRATLPRKKNAVRLIMLTTIFRMTILL